jgi:sulfite reductase alpha subunit-like flavoprotein
MSLLVISWPSKVGEISQCCLSQQVLGIRVTGHFIILFTSLGTGLAGVLSFLSVPRPQWTLYHGLRLLATENLLHNPVQLRAIHWAESRGPQPRYAWQALLEDGEYAHDCLWRLQGRIVVCGAARLARGVESALCTLLKRHSGLSHDDALNGVKALHVEGRMMVDVWN